ncbi:30473_t:CDS:2 [Gigaspora margarita]|uniref:30473_t:CDS:1 n=1 Tax=Gigaspora margarita TaxID=4874 RepID=A0ABN7UJ63_GIGMA|nr:30473_t:CDS:2 [Gigaspora margarita]
MNKWYLIVPFSFAPFSVLYGILFGIRQCKDFKCITDAYFSVVILSSIGFIVSLIFGLVVINKNCKVTTNKWYWIVPYSLAFFDIYYGIILGTLQLCTDDKCYIETYVYVVAIIATNVNNLTVATNVNDVIEIQGIQAHNVVDEESELEKEIRLLEKQKKIAELKKEIKDIEAVELSTSKNIIANTS